MGIISKGSNIDGVCGKVKGNIHTTVGVTVPGKIVHWIKSFKATEKIIAALKVKVKILTSDWSAQVGQLRY